MKWSKYESLEAKYPWMHSLISFALNGPIAHCGGLKEVVRTKVGFIAFRPFDSLDMTASHSSASSVIPGSPYKYVEMTSWTAVYYYVYFHIRGSGGERIAYPDEGKSLVHCIEDRKQWFVGCEELKDTTLVFDRVVKEALSGSSYAGLTNVSFEIYEFPTEKAGTRHPLRTPGPYVNPLELATHRAYLSGSEMPPLMPSPMVI